MQIVGWKKYCELLGIELPAVQKYCDWKSRAVSEAQKRYLRSLGVGSTGLKTQGQASAIISIAVWRKSAGLATPGQLLVLRELKVVNAEKRSMSWVKSYFHQIGYVSKCPEWVKVARNGG